MEDWEDVAESWPIRTEDPLREEEEEESREEDAGDYGPWRERKPGNEEREEDVSLDGEGKDMGRKEVEQRGEEKDRKEMKEEVMAEYEKQTDTKSQGSLILERGDQDEMPTDEQGRAEDQRRERQAHHPGEDERGMKRDEAEGQTVKEKEEVMRVREEGEEEERMDGWKEAEGEGKEKKEEEHSVSAVSLVSESIPHSTAEILLAVPAVPVSQETPPLLTPSTNSQSEAADDHMTHQPSPSVAPRNTLPPQPSAEPQEAMLLANRLSSHDDLTKLQNVMENSQPVHMREVEPIPTTMQVQVSPISKAVISTTDNPESEARYNTHTTQPGTSSGKNKQKLSQKAIRRKIIRKPKSNQTAQVVKSKVQRTVTKLSQNLKQQPLSPLNKAIPNQLNTTTLNKTQGEMTLKPNNNNNNNKQLKKRKDKITRSLKKDKKEKKNKKEKKEEVPTTPYFPFFKDDYCPTDCACYGR